MDQLTFETIILGGILITLIFLGGKLIGKIQGIIDSLDDINKSIQELNRTVSGGNVPPPPPPGFKAKDNTSASEV